MRNFQLVIMSILTPILTISYKAIITSLMIALIIFVFIEITTKPPFNETFDLFVSGVILFSTVICIGFISYGTAWIFKDTR